MTDDDLKQKPTEDERERSQIAAMKGLMELHYEKAEIHLARIRRKRKKERERELSLDS